MVRLEEVEDEEILQGQDGPVGGEDDWDTDSDDSASTASDDSIGDDIASESLYDRLVALQDMLPPSQRRFITSSVLQSKSILKTGLSWGGNALWVVSTSLLLLGVPWALAYAEEQQMVEMEREMQMQQKAGELLTAPGAGGAGQVGGGDAQAAL